MARNESDREDLMGEATALVRRIELSIVDTPEVIVAGFRKTGALSIYFGADPVYHVDEKMQLRRAYVGGLLYRTQGETLAQLDRQRTETTTLNRHDLTEDEYKKFCQTLETNIQSLLIALQKKSYSVHQQIPTNIPLIEELQQAVALILKDGIQLAPAIATKKI